MNKHIKGFSDLVYENLGMGSVLLIKGAPTHLGRRLYATTIKGYSQLNPGMTMVFLGDQIYQVIYKNGRFFGARVDYTGEDGLKGIFNLKNPGVPSLVLNHNKTPYHWITTKHADIGSALREVGDRLFDHEIILESSDDMPKAEYVSPERTIALEFMKLLVGEPSILLINQVEEDNATSYSWEIESDDWNDGPGRVHASNYWWSLSYDISINGDILEDSEIENFAEGYEKDNPGIRLIKYLGFGSMFDVPYDDSPTGLSIYFEFISDIQSHSILHRGGYQEDDEWEHVDSKLKHKIDAIYVGGEEIVDDPELRKYLDRIINMIDNKEIPDIYNDIIGKNLLTKIKP